MEPQSTGKFILGIAMVLIYLGVGASFILSDIFNINTTLRIIIGALFVLYGVFRGVRLLKDRN